MKKSAIVSIFYGERGHCETMKFAYRDEELEVRIKELDQKLKKELGERLYRMHNEYIDLLTQSDASKSNNYFKEGFKLGFDLANELNEE